MDILSAIGLSSAAGLNAYIPLLAVGLVDRYTNVIDLGPTWSWLSNGWVLTVLAVALAIELVADKIPLIDSFNDFIQSVIRPTAGGIVFSSGVSQTNLVDSSGNFAWTPFLTGLAIAALIHFSKMLSRPVVNASTATLATPFVSASGDAASVLLSVTAIFVPLIAVIVVVAVAAVVGWGLYRATRVRARSR